MIERQRGGTAQPTQLRRDERSMRVLEYALAFVAFGSAILLAVR